MPGRKSNVSIASTGGEDAAEPTPTRATKSKDPLSVEHLSLPKSMVARLAKGVLPANTQIHKDALLALHKSATVFVSYIASNSNDNAQASGKKTIAPQDVIAALKDAELEEFLPRVEAELKKYNDMQCDKRNTYRRKVKEEKAAAATTADKGDDVASPDVNEAADTTDGSGIANGHDAEADDAADRPFKKFKRDNGGAVGSSMLDADEVDDEADQDADEDDELSDDAHEDDDEVDEEDDVDEEGEEGDDQREDDAQDEEMGDGLEEATHGRREIHDEALDDPDSD